MEQEKIIIHIFNDLLNDYLNHMNQSELLKNIPNSNYIVCLGINSIIHIFKIFLNRTKNINTTYFHCQKAFYCYLEYIEQLNKLNLIHNLKFFNAISFIYKNTFTELDNEISKQPNNFSSNNDNGILIHSPSSSSSSFIQTIPSQNKVSNILNNCSLNTSSSWVISNEATNNYQKKKKSIKKEYKDTEIDQSIIDSILITITAITQKLIFFVNVFNFENGEHSFKDKCNIVEKLSISTSSSDSNVSIPSITSPLLQIQYILNNYNQKYLLLFYSNNYINKTYIFDFIIRIKEQLQFDFNNYCDYLNHVYKFLKKPFKVPDIQQLNNRYNEFFFNVESLSIPSSSSEINGDAESKTKPILQNKSTLNNTNSFDSFVISRVSRLSSGFDSTSPTKIKNNINSIIKMIFIGEAESKTELGRENLEIRKN